MQNPIIQELSKQVLDLFIDHDSERTFQQLYEKIHETFPLTPEILKDVLLELTSNNKIKGIFRVYSLCGDGLKDFKHFSDIPKIMEDCSQDPPVNFEIGLSNICVIFSLI